MIWLTALLSVYPLAPSAVRSAGGIVYLDRNANGTRDAGEPGIAGVAVSDQVTVVVSGADGSFRLDPLGGFGLVFVSVPSGYRAQGPFWRTVDSTGEPKLEFGLVRAPLPDDFTFIHASDTHIDERSRPRTVRLRALIDSIRPAFVLVSGDLVRDALRVSESTATACYETYRAEIAKIAVPVWSAPGNHEIFGIERDQSKVSADHPLYGRRMYRHHLGPDYYSFNTGGIHFVALNSVDIDDTRYYGHVDSVQVAWLERDLAQVPASTPVITFNHIPFFGTGEQWGGYMEGGPAPSIITVNGRAGFRHVVSNAQEILAAVRGHPYPLALGGHYHQREILRYELRGQPTEFHNAAAVVGPSDHRGGRMVSGISVYHVRHSRPDGGRFVPLGIDPP